MSVCMNLTKGQVSLIWQAMEEIIERDTEILNNPESYCNKHGETEIKELLVEMIKETQAVKDESFRVWNTMPSNLPEVHMEVE